MHLNPGLHGYVFAFNAVVGRLNITIHLTNHHLVDQPCSQGLSSEGRKTLVQAGSVPPKKWEVTKKQQEGDVTKSRFCLSLTHYGRGKFV